MLVTMWNRIRVLRLACRLSQQELARRVGIARQTLSMIENGKITPSAATAARICQVLGRPFEEVFPQEQEVGRCDSL